MANLIIKPNSATGDKLILQDRDGGAVLTTADSGIASLKLSPTATGSAPSGSEGALYYDSDIDSLMVYDTAWRRLGPALGTASGGTETTYTGYKVHTFLADGTLTVNEDILADILIVGGGASGGHAHGGGGGAGGMIVLPQFELTSGTYAVTVGAGGVGTQNENGRAGGNSSILKNGITRSSADPTIALGGGGGGGEASPGNAEGGGSGGGGIYNSTGGASSMQTHNDSQLGASYGTSGGNCANSGAPYPGGGGGGAGGYGAQGTGSSGGNGGVGRQNDFRTGSNIYYAGGGGGSVYGSGTGGTGGNGGGGFGGQKYNRAAQSGTANSGGGGGGNERYNTTMASGGSGIVVIRYEA